jgi:CRP-like cAMP-binding protein
LSSVKVRTYNKLLLLLSDEALASLGPMQRVDLPLREKLEIADEPITHVYFLDSGLASVVAEIPDIGSIEVGMVGNEGMTGLAVVEQDTRSPFETFIQGAASASRFEADHVRAALEESAEVRSVFLRYARTFAIQVGATAFANGQAKLEARLCRWLLMVGDRLGNSFNVTHEFLGLMLAVRRSGVTLALQLLEGKGLIRAARGSITIVDRAGLVANANGAYGLPEREYRRIMG